MRVSSATLPPSSGTLKSTRMKTRFPEFRDRESKVCSSRDDSVGKIGAYILAAMSLIRSRQRHE